MLSYLTTCASSFEFSKFKLKNNNKPTQTNKHLAVVLLNSLEIQQHAG